MRKFVPAFVAVAAACLLAGAGSAGKPTSPGQTTTPPACAPGDISIAATACKGFYEGNILNSNSANVTQTQAALSALGYNWDGSFKNVVKLDSLKGAHDLDFGKTLTGITYIGVHYGNGNGSPGNNTAFYVLDAAQGINRIHLNYNASSDVVLFVTALSNQIAATPEPSTWMTMIGGFGLIGWQMRRQRRTAAATTA